MATGGTDNLGRQSAIDKGACVPDTVVTNRERESYRIVTNGANSLEPSTYDLTDLASYLAFVKVISETQVGLDDDAILSGGRTALELGKLAEWNDGKAETKGEFGKLSKPYSDAKPGKLSYALEYKQSLEPATSSLRR